MHHDERSRDSDADTVEEELALAPYRHFVARPVAFPLVNNEGSPPCPSRWSPTTGSALARSGLSIDAQRAAVTRFAEAEGFEGARAGEGGLKQAKEQAMGKVQETQGNLPIWLQTQDTK